MKLASLVRILPLILSVLVLGGCSAESKRARVLDRAAGFYKKGEFEKARIEYQNVLQGDPDNITANERLALIWLERGAPMRAAPFLAKMKTVAPGNLEMRLKLGQLMLSLGNAAEAKREAMLILGRSAAFPDALVLLTEAIRNQADLKEAEQVLERFSMKGETGYLIAAANIASLRGDMNGARNSLRRAITNDPKAPGPHLAMGNFLATQNVPAETLAEFKLAADLSPPNGMARLRYAAYLAQTGAVTESVAYLKELRQKVPDFIPALRALTQIAIAEKRYDEAQTHVETLFRNDPFDYESRILRARLWQAQGDAKKAIEDLEQFGKDFPGLAIEKHQLALAYLQNNDLPNAIKSLEAAVGRNADNVDAIMLLAQLHLRGGTPQTAALLMSELVSRRPNFLPAYPILIETMRILGRLDQAVTVLGNNIKNQPNNAQLHYLLGLVLMQQQKLVEARTSLEAALKLAPDHLLVSSELISIDLKEGKTAAALERAKTLTTKAPASAVARLNEARVYLVQKNWAQAEAAALKTIELDAKQNVAYSVLTDALLAQKGDPAMNSRLEAFLAKRPGDELAAIVAGQIYTQTGQYAKARDMYEKLLAAKPDSTVVLNNLASLCDEKLNQSDRALEAARRARKLEPASPVIADTLGWILHRRKEHPEAAALLQEAAKGLPGNPEVQYHLGMVEQALGRKEAAVTALKAAAGAAAEFNGKEEAKRQLAALEGR